MRSQFSPTLNYARCFRWARVACWERNSAAANKALFAIGSLCFLAFTLYPALSRETARDTGRIISIGLGNVTPTSVDYRRLAGGIGIPRVDVPKLVRSVIQRDKWGQEHFELRDAAGTCVPVRRNNSSCLISGPTAGTPEFVLHDTPKPGLRYNVDYIAIAGEPMRDRYTLTAPSENTDPERVVFSPVG